MGVIGTDIEQTWYLTLRLAVKIIDAYNDARREESRERWEQTRLMAHTIYSFAPFLKGKRVGVKQFMPFEWDKDTNIEITPEQHERNLEWIERSSRQEAEKNYREISLTDLFNGTERS